MNTKYKLAKSLNLPNSHDFQSPWMAWQSLLPGLRVFNRKAEQNPTLSQHSCENKIALGATWRFLLRSVFKVAAVGLNSGSNFASWLNSLLNLTHRPRLLNTTKPRAGDAAVTAFSPRWMPPAALPAATVAAPGSERRRAGPCPLRLAVAPPPPCQQRRPSAPRRGSSGGCRDVTRVAWRPGDARGSRREAPLAVVPRRRRRRRRRLPGEGAGAGGRRRCLHCACGAGMEPWVVVGGGWAGWSPLARRGGGARRRGPSRACRRLAGGLPARRRRERPFNGHRGAGLRGARSRGGGTHRPDATGTGTGTGRCLFAWGRVRGKKCLLLSGCGSSSFSPVKTWILSFGL